jgi:hypothetical protein
MQTSKTYFEQVPLDAIKKIVEEDIRSQTKVQKPVSPRAEAVEEEPSLAGANYRAGGRS